MAMVAQTMPQPDETLETTGALHRPVLLHEAVALLRPRPGMIVVDATVGAGGHAEALLEAVGEDGRLYGIDRDPEILEISRRRLARFGERFVPIHGNHGEIQALLAEHGVFAVDVVLADLGVSSFQLDRAERGFSFLTDGPLDMRMDRGGGTSAADLVARLTAPELKRILAEYGEERNAGRLARAIVEERSHAPIRTTRQLAELVERVAGPAARRYRIHPATRTFQALRIAVNAELDSIEALLAGSVSLLRRGGRIVLISFHSLEDRSVKQGLRKLAERCICPPGLPVCGCGRENLIRILTKRPLVPTPAEVERNPRARSAHLRAAERV
jgi:16S rRNA (cytosine1402-N4)-methyltransferase